MRGGIVSSVLEKSPAQHIGIRSGDEVLSVNGHLLRDVIDYQYFAAEEELEILVRRYGETLPLHLQREYGEDLGVEFAAPVFDGMRRCANHCEFCFVDQMPPGLRRSLYVKDDDYRYSFLYGNFITLSNLADDDWVRLAEQRLSPLYVSVHATDVGLRRTLLGNPSAPDIVPQLHRLRDLGVEVHAQIVLCPGLNDADALGQTVSDLVALWPTIASVAIVPVGLTRFHRGGLRAVSREDAGRLVERFGPEQSARYRRSCGVGLVYLADEIYFLAGERVPAACEYDGYPQLENGVGLTRLFLDEWEEVRNSVSVDGVAYADVAIATGTLFASPMDRIAGEMERASGARVSVHPIENRFFGPTVTVSGLLTGQDVLCALRGRLKADLLLLPRTMFDSRGCRTLDDWDRERLTREVGTTVEVVGTPREMLAAVLGAPQDKRQAG